MTKQEIAEGMRQFILMAFIGPENLETGFLTRQRVNPLEKDEIIEFSQTTEYIVNQVVKLYADALNGQMPDDYSCGILFQYIFDKTTEAAYKKATGKEVDTVFMLKDAFDYYEPDLPEYIQLKLTSVVRHISIINSKVLRYLDDNKCRINDITQWMPAYLMAAAIIAMQFAQEIV